MSFLVSEIKRALNIAGFPAPACSCCQTRSATANRKKVQSRINDLISTSYGNHRVVSLRPGIEDRAAANLAAFTSAFVRSLLRFAAFAI
jgi:hypothetical protein